MLEHVRCWFGWAFSESLVKVAFKEKCKCFGICGIKGLFTLGLAALWCCVDQRPLAKAAKMTVICQSALRKAARATQQAQRSTP